MARKYEYLGEQKGGWERVRVPPGQHNLCDMAECVNRIERGWLEMESDLLVSDDCFREEWDDGAASLR